MQLSTLKNLEPCTWSDVELMNVSEWNMSVEEFEKLIEEYKANPNDVTLISYIAFVFYLNVSACEDSISLDVEHIKGLEKDIYFLDFFELAYKINPTIETIHNYANVLFILEEEPYEYIIDIQSQCISLQPKSSIPYTSLAYMYIYVEDYEQAMKYYEIALETALKNNEKADEIYPNLGVCYYKAQQYHKAIDIYKNLYDDNNRIFYLFNLAICYTNLNDRTNFLSTIEKIKKQNEFYKTDTRFLALYIPWHDYEEIDKYIDDNTCYLCSTQTSVMVMQVIYQINRPKFYNLIENGINFYLNSIDSFKKNNPVYIDFSESITINLHKQIEYLRSLEEKFKNESLIYQPNLEIFYYEPSWFFPKLDE